MLFLSSFDTMVFVFIFKLITIYSNSLRQVLGLYFQTIWSIYVITINTIESLISVSDVLLLGSFFLGLDLNYSFFISIIDLCNLIASWTSYFFHKHSNTWAHYSKQVSWCAFSSGTFPFFGEQVSKEVLPSKTVSSEISSAASRHCSRRWRSRTSRTWWLSADSGNWKSRPPAGDWKPAKSVTCNTLIRLPGFTGFL